MSQETTHLIAVENGKAVTTSLKIAEVFGKLHKHVLAAIRNNDCSEEFRRTNFRQSEQKKPGGPQREKVPGSASKFRFGEFAGWIIAK